MNYSVAIKNISDSLLVIEDAQARLLALCNRAYCYQQLGLHRKALKVGVHALYMAHAGQPAWSRNRLTSGTDMQDYDEALSSDVSCVLALVRKGKALWALKRTEVPVMPLQRCRIEAGTRTHAVHAVCAGGSETLAASMLGPELCSRSGSDR